MALQVGSRLGHYTVDALIGEGGMGQVYQATDTKLNRQVALKILPEAFAEDPERLARFQREAQVLASLNHPGIAAIYGLEESGDTRALVLELVEGPTLADRIKQGPIPVGEALPIAKQIAGALEAAHQAGVIHRDLKPANIKVRDDGTVKLLDFGLAKGLDLPQHDEWAETATTLGVHTVSGVILGTPAYMSPEQTRGDALDPRSDIFSLGSVLYEVVTGMRAFGGSSLVGTLVEVTTLSPPAPSSLRSELPAYWDGVLLRALAKERDRRYSSVADLLADLNGQLEAPLSPGSVREEHIPDPVFGREPELERLDALLAAAVDGAGKFALVTGEPGIGKTALSAAFVFAAQQNHRGLLLGRGACIEQHGTGAVYLPFLDALDGLFHGSGGNQVIALFRRHAPTWCLQFPAVFSRHDIEQLQREVIGATKDRLLRELGDALSALAAERPVVLLLEDLHWVDPPSVDLLRNLSQRARRQRLLILGTARPEDIERSNHPLKSCKTDLQAHGLCDEIALLALGPQHVAAYLDAHFSPNTFSPNLADMIHRKTEGHPLFATGTIQLLAERGDILRRDGAWTLAQPLSETTLDVPESVRSMIEQKVGVLTEDQTRVLRYASIEGAEFFSTVLAALLEADELHLEEQLDQIARTHGWIRRQGEEELPDGSLATRYRFTHVLYQNFLYGELLPKRRVLLHRRAGEALEQAFGGSAAQIATILAMHFERGRDFARAVTYYAEAGDTARVRYANREAVAHYSQGLDLTEKLVSESRSERQRVLLPQRALARLALGSLKEAGDDYAAVLQLCEAAGDGEGECRACLGLATVAMMGRDVPGLEKYGQQAHQLAEAIGNQALVAEATNQGAVYLQVTGSVTEALREYEKSIPLARRLDHRPALVYGLTFRGVAHFFRSEYKEAEAAELEASRLAAEARDGMHLPLSLYYLGLSQANQGRLSEALANMHEGLELATRNHNAVAMSRIPNGIGWVWRELGDLRKAIEYNEGCVEVARRTGMVEAESNSLINLIYDYSLAGDPGAAETAIEQVNPLYDGREPWNRWRFYEVRHQAAAAEFWLSRLKLDLAEEHARTLLKNAERYRVPKYVAVARRLLGEIAMLLGDANTAEEELNRSLEPFATHPVPLTEWKNRAALARVLAQRDRPAAARQAFSEALAVINTIASGVTDQAARQRFLKVDDVREVVAGSTG